MISTPGQTRSCWGHTWSCRSRSLATTFCPYASGSYSSRIVFFKDGQEFLPGIQAMFTPGHTKERACFILSSGNESMCLIGDLSHHPVRLLERPRSQFIDDVDPPQAAETRVKVLGMLPKERVTVYGGHFPWPGVGHVAEENGGFRYFPEATRWFPNHRVVHATQWPILTGVLQSIIYTVICTVMPKNFGCLCSLSTTALDLWHRRDHRRFASSPGLAFFGCCQPYASVGVCRWVR